MTTSTTSSSPTGAVSTTTTAAAQPLAGKVVVLDPGHNEHNAAYPGEINRQVAIGNGSKECDTTGSETNAGYPEAAFNTDVANRVAARLEALGARVILTRDPATPWGPCITERAAIGNRANADAAISIHADGGPPGGRGFHVIQPGLVAGYNDQIVGPSHRLALAIHDAYAAATGLPTATYIGSGGYDTRTDLGGLNLSVVPKVFIECGNLRNATDAALLSDAAFRDRVADGIARGLTAFVTAVGSGSG